MMTSFGSPCNWININRNCNIYKKEIGILIKKEIAIYGVTGLILIENCNVSISILKGQIND